MVDLGAVVDRRSTDPAPLPAEVVEHHPAGLLVEVAVAGLAVPSGVAAEDMESDAGERDMGPTIPGTVQQRITDRGIRYHTSRYSGHNSACLGFLKEEEN